MNKPSAMKVIPIETKPLGDRSYLIVSGAEAAVIDPQRDIDRIEDLLVAHGAQLTHVFETHIHNDYVSGGRALAHRFDCSYVLPAADAARCDHTGASPDDEFQVGTLILRALHTPGHTPHHLSYVLLENDTPQAVFTGGSMLYGTVGRTDLVESSMTEDLTRAQFRSVRALAALPDQVSVHPTHGFGSFCSSSASSGVDQSTIGTERKTNLAFTASDEDSFVRDLMAGLTAYPRYYAHMAPLNREGAAPVDLSTPELVDPDEIRRRIDAGEWVVDLRGRKIFAAEHLAGTVNVELGDSFTTYLGWTLPWDTPVTLVADTITEVAEAQRQLVRIGIDRPTGAASGGPDHWGAGGDLRSFRTATFVELARASGEAGEIHVLDVRRDDEWAQGHIDGAIHIPLHDLERDLGCLPRRDLWVHCGSGYRAAIAASLLDRAGLLVVAVDDDWSEAAGAGLPIVIGDQ